MLVNATVQSVRCFIGILLLVKRDELASPTNVSLVMSTSEPTISLSSLCKIFPWGGESSWRAWDGIGLRNDSNVPRLLSALSVKSDFNADLPVFVAVDAGALPALDSGVTGWKNLSKGCSGAAVRLAGDTWISECTEQKDKISFWVIRESFPTQCIGHDTTAHNVNLVRCRLLEYYRRETSLRLWEAKFLPGLQTLVDALLDTCLPSAALLLWSCACITALRRLRFKSPASVVFSRQPWTFTGCVGFQQKAVDVVLQAAQHGDWHVSCIDFGWKLPDVGQNSSEF